MRSKIRSLISITRLAGLAVAGAAVSQRFAQDLVHQMISLYDSADSWVWHLWNFIFTLLVMVFMSSPLIIATILSFLLLVLSRFAIV